MLKSTYKPPVSTSFATLPEGWTEHKAPTGHPYYYHSSTKTSTYTRPQTRQPQAQYIPPSDLNTFTQFPQHEDPSLHPRATDAGYQPFSALTGNHPQPNGNYDRGRGGSYYHHQRSLPRDRPKSKHKIPGCEPWLLVETRLGRRFVYNPEQNASFWKFPPNVTKGVVEYDRQEREKRQAAELKQNEVSDSEQIVASEAENMAVEDRLPTAAPRPLAAEAHPDSGSDDEYEEVEVTDDEGDAEEAAHSNPGEFDSGQPVEFNEDDIAFQLEAMGQDYGLDPGEYGEGGDEDLEEGAEGLPLTEEDSRALFKDMLDDYHISPYTTWEALIDVGRIVEDDRYTVLQNMRSRKEVWGEWSRDKAMHLKETREREEKKDPKISYLAFLQARATPKLYWPEFRRKYQKESEMRSTKLTDKDREKLYREYINRLKLPESRLKADLVTLLKSIPIHALNCATAIENIPPALLTDLRFVSLRASIRDPLVEAHISTLPSAPTQLEASPEEEQAVAKARHERERREQALTERQRNVQEEKRRQQNALRYSKDILQEGNFEVEQAMRVGKDGLLGYMETNRENK